MQLLLEFLPLLAFLGTYLHQKDIYTATVVLMAAMVLSLAILWVRQKRIPAMFGISTLLVLVFGAATIFLRNPRFIQWKPTILLWGMALFFLGSAYIGRQPLAQRMLGPALGDIQLSRRDWMRLNWAWVVFCLATGLANLAVAYHADESTWVKIKTFGLMGAMMLFLVGQVLWLQVSGRLKS